MDMAISARIATPRCSCREQDGMSCLASLHSKRKQQRQKQHRGAQAVQQYTNLSCKARLPGFLSSFAVLPPALLQYTQISSSSPGGQQSSVVISRADGRSQATSVASPPPFPPPQSQIGSPLLWIGVGVGISVVFSWAARRVQGYAMQQALKSMMQQTGEGTNSFATGPGSSFFSGKDFSSFAGQGGSLPFRSPPSPAPPSPLQAAAPITVDVSTRPAPSAYSETQVNVAESSTLKKPAFRDVDINLLAEQEVETQEQPLLQVTQEKVQTNESNPFDAATSFPGSNGYANTPENGKKSLVSLEMLEQMLDDPKVQKMVFPYLPEQMRDPDTFKRMIQLPPVRQQLQEALNNMDREDGMDMLKYMNSDVVKQQFDQMGITPEEAVGKILASPDIAASLQNPKVVEAIMDCSQNPINITKYQNDKEVMDALLKIAELFPGGPGS